jgi:small subunit ribosomal protein S1
MTEPTPTIPETTSQPAPVQQTPADAGSAPAKPQAPQKRDDRRGPKPPRREKPPFRPGMPPAMEPAPFFSAPKLSDLDKSIEDELASAMAGFDEQAIAETEAKNKRPEQKPGERRKGKVISIHGADVFIDIPGGRSQGMMPLQQFDKPPVIGDEVEFDVEGYDSANGVLRLSRGGAAQMVTDWSSVSLGMNVEAKVTGTNKGGLSVEVNGIRAFMPFREIDIYRTENPEALVNQKIICEVIELDPHEHNLVVSRRKLLERERERQKEKFWQEIEEGQVRTGVVRGIQPFGVFVDLGGADGLIPMSELAWARVEKAEDLVKIGQSVQVKVTKVDFAKHKIALSLKQLAASPWDNIVERVHVGTRITGKVTRTTEFGAFVEVEPGIEGLIHISELGTNRVRRVRDVVQEGQDVEAQVVSVDTAQRRIGLSLKAIVEAKLHAENEVALAEQRKRDEEEDAEAEKEAEELRQRKRNYILKGGK